MKFSPNEMRVLGALDLRPITGIREICGFTGLKASAAQYTLNKLKSSGVLYERVRVNFFRIGLLDTGVFFSLSDLSRQARARVEQRLSKDRRVAWMGSLAGQYQYAITSFARSFSETAEFLRSLSSISGEAMSRRVIAPRISFSQFNRAHLSKYSGKRRQVELAPTPEIVDLDDLDRKLLTAAANSHFDSLRAIARAMGEPFSTIERRFQNLVESGVIAGTFYEVAQEKLGISTFRIHLNLRSFTPELEKKIDEYCLREPRIIFCTKTMGSWDIELGIETREMPEVVHVTGEISDICGAQLSSLDVMGEVRDIKWSFYP